MHRARPTGERAAQPPKRRACAPSPRARKPLFCPAPPRVYAFIYTQHTAYPIYFCTFVGLETAEGAQKYENMGVATGHML